MKRYHKQVYFPGNSQVMLSLFCDVLARQDWGFTCHTLENIKHRDIDKAKLLNYIKHYSLQAEDIFEYYQSDNGIVKVCFRISWTDNLDIILVVNKNKCLITIYLNGRDDLHYTLNESIYNKG